MAMVAAMIVAMVSIMGWLWLIPWDGYGCYYGWYHGIAMVAAMVAAMAERSVNDGDGYGRAKW